MYEPVETAMRGHDVNNLWGQASDHHPLHCLTTVHVLFPACYEAFTCSYSMWATNYLLKSPPKGRVPFANEHISPRLAGNKGNV